MMTFNALKVSIWNQALQPLGWRCQVVYDTSVQLISSSLVALEIPVGIADIFIPAFIEGLKNAKKS